MFLTLEIGHEGAVNSLNIDSESLTLISGSWDSTAKIWDLESGECTSTLEGHKYAVTVCRLSDG